MVIWTLIVFDLQGIKELQPLLEMIDYIHEFVLEKCWLAKLNFAEITGISVRSVHKMLNFALGTRKLLTRWASHLFNSHKKHIQIKHFEQ